MITERLRINKDFPEANMIKAAVQRLNNGEVVAFPTETVYGLGAVATNVSAVEQIFAAKGRPPTNPLIIHIGQREQAYPLVKEWTAEAEKLAQTFWPGPLTLVLAATDQVPAIVRGGGTGVGIRMPAHPVALALINACSPLAAPSANRSGLPSPRTGDEVWEDLAGRISLLLDAGATPGGLESTVLDLTQEEPRIIRPGGIPREQIARCLNREVLWIQDQSPASALPHYQTTAQLMVTTCTELEELLNQLTGKRVAIIANNIPKAAQKSGLPIFNLEKAGELYSLLRRAEKEKVEVLILAKDAGLPWDEALEHRVQAAKQSWGLGLRSDTN